MIEPILPLDVARCEGHGAGPTGHQHRADCVNCKRRLASRISNYTSYLAPDKEYPCPNRLPLTEENDG